MMQQQWWHSDPVAPSQGTPQPVIAPVPSPQTPDQAAITHESAIRMHDQNQHIDPDTLRMMAQRYVMDGTQPNFGMGNAVDRRNFWEAVGHEVASTGGSGADLAVRVQQFRNGMHVIRGLEQQLENIAGNERTAIANGEVYAHAANQQPSGTQTNYPILNSISRALGYNTGNADIPATAESRNTFANEYARVVSSTPSGSGQLTDSAREQALAAFGPNLSPDQRRATLDIMRLDMNNRVNALRSTIQEAYARLRQGQPISASPNGDLLDERGQVVPVPGVRRSGQSSAPETPPVMGAPPGSGPAGGRPPSGGSPPIPNAPGGEHMDATTTHMGPSGDQVALNTAGMERTADPALAGLNQHVAEMMNNRSIPAAQIRQYVEQRGIPWSQVRGDASLAFRERHPDYQWQPSDIRLDQQLAPVSTYRNMATNLADTTPGTALITAGNMVAGQELPNLVGATGGDAELTRLGIDELRNRHPIGALAGDIGGAALTYAGASGATELGLNAAERAAPSLFARLPAWVRAGTTAGEAGATASPTATFAPRAAIGDASLGAYESPGDRTEGALVGLGTGAGFRGTLNTAGRAISPTGGPLAPAYEEGVQPTLGQRMGGVGNRMEQAFQSVPILGGVQRGARNAAIDQWQLGGFNRALRNLPDEPQLPAGTEPGTAPHAFAQGQFDKAYDRVHQRINVVSDDQLQQDLANIRQSATTTLSAPALDHFNRVLDNSVMRRLNPRGTLEEFQRDGSDRFLNYVTPDGQRTVMHVSLGDNGRAEISVDPFSQTSNQLGPATIRDAASQLRTMYPEIKSVYGVRDSGANPGRIQEVPLPATPSGLSGSDLQATLSEIRRTARSQRTSPLGDNELAGQLDDLAAAIHDNAARHSPPEAIKTLGDINRGYAMLTRIESAANRPGVGEPGEYTAKALLSADRQQGGLRGRQWLAGNGLMTDYANAGLRLGQTVGDSGTGERLLALGGAGAAGILPHFVGTAGILPAAAYAADTVATLPGVRSGVNWLLRPNGPAIRPFTDVLRQQIQSGAGIGSAIGLPPVVAAYATQP